MFSTIQPDDAGWVYLTHEVAAPLDTNVSVEQINVYSSYTGLAPVEERPLNLREWAEDYADLSQPLWPAHFCNLHLVSIPYYSALRKYLDGCVNVRSFLKGNDGQRKTTGPEAEGCHLRAVFDKTQVVEQYMGEA